MKTIRKDYKYVESGLDNVILTGIQMHQCECGEEMPLIKNIKKLNRLIANALVKKSVSLNGREFRFIRKQMGFKAKEIARLIGVNPVSVSRWETSSEKIGLSSDKLLRMLYMQKLQEQTDNICKDTLKHINSINRMRKQEIIKIHHEELVTNEYDVDPENRLASKLKELFETNDGINLCENISNAIKESGLSENPLVQIIQLMPEKLCPVVYHNMLKDEMKQKASMMIDELFKGKEKDIQENRRCPVKEMFLRDVTHQRGSIN